MTIYGAEVYTAKMTLAAPGEESGQAFFPHRAVVYREPDFCQENNKDAGNPERRDTGSTVEGAV